MYKKGSESVFKMCDIYKNFFFDILWQFYKITSSENFIISFMCFFNAIFPFRNPLPLTHESHRDIHKMVSFHTGLSFNCCILIFISKENVSGILIVISVGFNWIQLIS